MSKTDTVSPLRQRMIEDMAARKLNPHTQRSHIQSCQRFAAWLKRSPDTATPDEVRRFQLYLIESGASICNRNRIMTGVRFLFRVTLRRHDLAAEVWHLKEPQKLPPVLSPEEVKRILSMATSLKARVMLTLSYGCGLRAGEVVRLRACDIDSARWKTMRLHPHEFIRRFLLHVLPKGFHRIRHYGFLASANRAQSIATARALLGVAAPAAANPEKQPDITPDTPRVLLCPCPRCGARMIVIEVFARNCEPRWRPTPSRIDTS